MKCSVEISMYPLNVNYIEAILLFIKNLKKYPFINVETNGMSTQLFGDYDNVMTAIQKEIKTSFLLEQNVVFTMKVINSHLQKKPSI
tara:strand:+ start:197 stop:457 length:261 start_codon:yes stop_codon:yes gene_type:complete